MNPLQQPLRIDVGTCGTCFEGASRHLSMRALSFVPPHCEVLGFSQASKDALHGGALPCY